ncbi:hypothetical protein EDD11_009859 [Mortierella claussenii]|nr:hypothetical protein EDD11_009859 [Mortierella claussenii]
MALSRHALSLLNITRPLCGPTAAISGARIGLDSTRPLLCTLPSSRRFLTNSSASLRMSHMVDGYAPLRLLLIGSPGSGKGTQSGRIQDNFEVDCISSGDLLRKNIAQGTEIGKRAAKEMKNGAFVSDEVIVKLIDAELNKIGAHQGWLLDGFPRTMTQAKTLDKTLQQVNQPLNLVIHLDVPEEVILQRIMDRWVHIPSGRVYNMTYNPPKQAGIDDVTGEPLERRPDDNPVTVHAWATLQVFRTEDRLYGRQDFLFLERVFQKLLLNFTWWVNRKDTEGNNVFEGGFLGLDNIGLFNRSEPLPNGATLRQADGTSWMAFFSLCMLHIALELAKRNPAYEDIASKFLEHFFHISDAMTYHSGGEEKSLWDSTDNFFYDSISWPGGHTQRLKTRSLVGVIPLFSILSLDPEYLQLFPGFSRRLEWLLAYREKHRPARVFKKEDTKESGSFLLALVDQTMLRAVLKRLLDENEFLSPFGIRSLSKFHKDNPLSMWMDGQEFRVDYLPAESDSGMFGGNSNWRGPIWLPTTYLVVTSLKRFHYFYGNDFKVECPTGSGIMKNLEEVAWEIEARLVRLVQRNQEGRRPANGGQDKTDKDPYFKDLVQFYEYFDAETGKGLGASHQTGWTGLLAMIVHQVGDKCKANSSAVNGNSYIKK